MFELTQLGLYIGACLLLAIAPGPGNFYIAARTLAGGRAEGIASSFGTGTGGLLHVIASALGISAIIMASAELFIAVKLIGAGYLIWIGLRTIRMARRETSTALAEGPTVPPIGLGRAFREGVIVETLNPKTAAFFMAFIPQFVDQTAGNIVLQFIILGIIVTVLNTIVDIGVAFAIGGIRQSARNRPTLIRRLRQASGGAMIALAVGLTVAKRS